jgi:hypothetical protein
MGYLACSSPAPPSSSSPPERKAQNADAFWLCQGHAYDKYETDAKGQYKWVASIIWCDNLAESVHDPEPGIRISSPFKDCQIDTKRVDCFGVRCYGNKTHHKSHPLPLDQCDEKSLCFVDGKFLPTCEQAAQEAAAKKILRCFNVEDGIKKEIWCNNHIDSTTCENGQGAVTCPWFSTTETGLTFNGQYVDKINGWPVEANGAICYSQANGQLYKYPLEQCEDMQGAICFIHGKYVAPTWMERTKPNEPQKQIVILRNSCVLAKSYEATYINANYSEPTQGVWRCYNKTDEKERLCNECTPGLCLRCFHGFYKNSPFTCRRDSWISSADQPVPPEQSVFHRQ